MASSGSSSSSQYYQEPGLSFEDGLIIAVGVLGFLMILVVLRFFCNCCIDVTFLGETGSAKKACGEIWRCLCPWWRPRTNPEQDDPSPNDIELLQQEIDVARTGMSAEAWKALLHSILPSKKVAAEDLASWKDAQGSCSDGACRSEDLDEHSHNHDHCTGIVCSICLHDIEIGDSAVTSKSCQHVFHNECISSWLQRNLACPYCRVDMISREHLQIAIRSQEQCDPSESV